jgi:hypothetical protein
MPFPRTYCRGGIRRLRGLDRIQVTQFYVPESDCMFNGIRLYISFAANGCFLMQSGVDVKETTRGTDLLYIRSLSCA